MDMDVVLETPEKRGYPTLELFVHGRLEHRFGRWRDWRGVLRKTETGFDGRTYRSMMDLGFLPTSPASPLTALQINETRTIAEVELEGIEGIRILMAITDDRAWIAIRSIGALDHVPRKGEVDIDLEGTIAPRSLQIVFTSERTSDEHIETFRDQLPKHLEVLEDQVISALTFVGFVTWARWNRSMLHADLIATSRMI